MTVSRCVSAVSDARSEISTPDSDSKALSDLDASEVADNEPSDTESERHSHTFVEEDDDDDQPEDEDIKGRFSRARSVRRISAGIRDLSERDQQALWISHRSPNVYSGTRCTSSLSFTPKPTSVLRSQSAQGVRRPPHTTEPVPAADNKACLSSFKRSLRLLGFNPHDFGIACTTEDVVDRPRRHVVKPRATPTLHTRVMRRSVSLDSLRDVVLHDKDGVEARASLEKLNRETLSRAVYEEWYFKKMTEARRKKELHLEEEKRKQEKMENAKEEKQRKSDEKFAQWLRELQVRQRKSAETKEPSARSMSQPMLGEPSKEKVDQAYQEWAKQKEKKQRLTNKVKNEELQMKKEKEKALQEKRADAIKVFNIWKKKSDEVLKRYALEREKNKENEEKLKQIKRRAKKENPGPPFQEWKKQKDSELKETAKKALLVKKEAEEAKKARALDRIYEAEQAFEEWLDGVEERRRGARRRRASQGDVPPPPWSPGGAVLTSSY